MPVGRTLIALAVLVVALSACGKKGPLYLPQSARMPWMAGESLWLAP